MLKIMDDIGDEHCEEVMLLHQIFKISNLHDIVHSLQRVNDVVLVMIRVLFEVSLSDLKYKLL